jgi:aminoglycoside phosphotransferase family enzyme
MSDVAKSLNFAERLAALVRATAFPFPLPPEEQVVRIQTHASVVLLAGDRAYKLKKPENFGFFDYSSHSALHGTRFPHCARPSAGPWIF